VGVVLDPGDLLGDVVLDDLMVADAGMEGRVGEAARYDGGGIEKTEDFDEDLGRDVEKVNGHRQDKTNQDVGKSATPPDAAGPHVNVQLECDEITFTAGRRRYKTDL